MHSGRLKYIIKKKTSWLGKLTFGDVALIQRPTFDYLALIERLITGFLALIEKLTFGNLALVERPTIATHLSSKDWHSAT
jgi:hypothetical protein